MARKKFYIQTKTKDCFPFDSWMTKLEMRAFGWRDKGYDSDFEGYDIDIDWDNNKAHVSQRFKIYHVFKRIKPYSRNFFFKIMELSMSIMSWIRRKLIMLLMGLFIIAVAISLLEIALGVANNDTYTALGIATLFIGIIYVPSLLMAFCAFIFRKITNQDEKLKSRLAENGYAEEQEF